MTIQHVPVQSNFSTIPFDKTIYKDYQSTCKTPIKKLTISKLIHIHKKQN